MNRSPIADDRATGEFPAVPASLADVRRFVRERAARSGLSAMARDELVLAVSEAATNTVRHSGSPTVRIRWRASRRRVVVTVEDDGFFRLGPKPEDQPAIEVLMPGGHGLTLMSASTDELDIRRGSEGSPGTRVQLVKRVRSPALRPRWDVTAPAWPLPDRRLQAPGSSEAAGPPPPLPEPLPPKGSAPPTVRPLIVDLNRRRDQKPQNGASASQGLQP